MRSRQTGHVGSSWASESANRVAGVVVEVGAEDEPASPSRVPVETAGKGHGSEFASCG
jgi:hypothetical protein